jgi:hypothetical protein
LTTLEEPASTTSTTTSTAEGPARLRTIAPDRALINPIQLRTLRELRAVVLDLQTLLEGIRSGATTLSIYESYVQEAKTEIQSLLDTIPPHNFDAESADAIRHLHNLWEQMSINPLMLNPATFGSANGNGAAVQDQLRHLNMLDDGCERLLFQIGILTIPARLNHWLSLGRAGYYIPFHEVFAPELPDYQDRMRVLRYLAWSPRLIRNGLVDPSTGLIYRYSGSNFVRWLSMLTIVVGFVLATALVYFSTQLPAIAGWPLGPAQATPLLAAWAAIAAGILVHVCITVAKGIQEQPNLPPALPIGDLPRLASAKLGSVLLKIVLALVGLYGLVLTAGIAQATPLQAFLAGYTLDSVVQLFGASIERRAASQVAGLREELGVTGQGS